MIDPMEVLFTCPDCKAAWRSHGLTLLTGRMCDECRKKLSAPPPFVTAVPAVEAGGSGGGIPLYVPRHPDALPRFKLSPDAKSYKIGSETP